ncbi:PT domain-containing protein [Streptomyces sp. LP05-1]|uniref:PT domain-containing protein n=1 Tax=Streptomyces pyxinae TaxID=2970734 RepID=A0ABT2CJY5_9ACTN|nr:PT domain-containing protein [Streptomyces sp. LP05-1]MCS0637739.1 PT domain-containing protein [Streptomyces sp. LP05-1]
MATSRAVPNLAFRELRGRLSPAEFAAAVRRAAREIGEQVACDARYVGRVEAGEIRCPNYAYERVFLHMFPGRTLTDLGFVARERVRGRRARPPAGPGDAAPTATRAFPPGDGPGAVLTTGLTTALALAFPTDFPGGTPTGLPAGSPTAFPTNSPTGFRNDEESDVLRRAFMTGGTATLAAASLGFGGPGSIPAPRAGGRVGDPEVRAVEEAVRRIRLLDDRYGADGLYRRAAEPLRAAYALLDSGVTSRRSTADRLHSGAGELSLSVGWLAHDSGRLADARSHYAEALATARMAGDEALEAHAFSNTSFLARDAGRHREALRAAQAGLRAARHLGSPRLLSLLTLREAGGRAGLGDRAACEEALGRARTLFGLGAAEADPEWMSFFGEPELEALEAQCWSALGDWPRAVRHAHRATALQSPHFARNLALYRAQLAGDLARGGRVAEAGAAGHQVLDLLDEVRSTRIEAILTDTARTLRPRRSVPEVAGFLERRTALAEV